MSGTVDTGIVDRWGQPIRRELLTQEITAPTTANVRSPIAGYPANGMDPVRLANILRSADQGEPMAYFELAEIIEERDLHYAGVLGTRKRSVSQIDITVEAASDDPEDVRRADMVREWLKRDELADETFDMLDAIGKGVSFTEIVWDTSEGQFWPQRLEWCDPRWFTFDHVSLRQPMLRGGVDGNGQHEPLPAFKYIYTQIKAKSGLPLRSGIARIAAWAWMFKAFTQRDWAIFTQTYGQPVRIGKFHEGAASEDKATLRRAVANIAGDCAAIIPSSMEIEFIEAKNVTAGADLYERRANWLDQQMSKAVLGQTTTTDAISGGHAVSQEHRQVQEDIETADCKALGATINRDLIRPWMDLEFGPSKKYPRVVIARPRQEDLKQLTDSLAQLVPLGLKVQQSEVRDKLGLSDPDPRAELLHPQGAPAAPAPGQQADPGKAAPGMTGNGQAIALQSANPADVAPPQHPAVQIAQRMAAQGQPMVDSMITAIEAMLAKAQDLGEFREMLLAAYGDLDKSGLASVIAAGLVAAQAAGRSDLVDESSAS